MGGNCGEGGGRCVYGPKIVARRHWPEARQVIGRLTTHVLDTLRGVPAVGVSVDLYAIRGGTQVLTASKTTGADGRTKVADSDSGELGAGVYELKFYMAEYFRRSGVDLSSPPLFGDVVIRIEIANADGHYHVPLLVSPYAYSTYRGS